MNGKNVQFVNKNKSRTVQIRTRNVHMIMAEYSGFAKMEYYTVLYNKWMLKLQL